jgi:hypothetical protein
MAEWAIYRAEEGASEDDHFCSLVRKAAGPRARLVGKTITQKELRSAIKAGCADFGLLDGFSSKSMRKTMVTAQVLSGASDAEVDVRGRFSARAKTASRYYSNARAIGGEVGGAGSITLAQVTALSKAVSKAKAGSKARATKIGKGPKAIKAGRAPKGGKK